MSSLKTHLGEYKELLNRLNVERNAQVDTDATVKKIAEKEKQILSGQVKSKSITQSEIGVVKGIACAIRYTCQELGIYDAVSIYRCFNIHKSDFEKYADPTDYEIVKKVIEEDENGEE